jgi:large subunit ribosomal protein L4
MAKLPIVNWDKEKVGEIAVPDEVFAYPFKRHLVWEVVKAHRAGQRAGTHKTKTRSEVSGTGKKPFRQKGTGRARQGGGRPPIHRHGGTSHGPVPRSYAQHVSVGEKKNALKAALSRRLKEERLMVLDALSLKTGRTKDLVTRVEKLGVSGKALFVDSRENENFARASRNVEGWTLVDALAINAHDVMKHGTLVLSQSALERVVEVLGG